MSLLYDMVLLRYDFIRCSELKDRSLTALVAGITRMREAKVHTAGSNALWGSESLHR